MIAPKMTRNAILINETGKNYYLLVPMQDYLLKTIFRDRNQCESFIKKNVDGAVFTDFYNIEEIYFDQDRRKKKDKIKYDFIMGGQIDLSNMSLAEFIQNGIEYFGQTDWDTLFTDK